MFTVLYSLLVNKVGCKTALCWQSLVFTTSPDGIVFSHAVFYNTRAVRAFGLGATGHPMEPGCAVGRPVWVGASHSDVFTMTDSPYSAFLRTNLIVEWCTTGLYRISELDLVCVLRLSSDDTTCGQSSANRGMVLVAAPGIRTKDWLN